MADKPGTTEDRRRDKRYLAWLIRNSKHPFYDMREWAKGGDRKERIRRWYSVNEFAAQHQEAAEKAKSREKWKDLHWDAHKKFLWLRDHPPEPVDSDGLTTFDAHQVASWIVNEVLVPARASDRWNGSVISGYRSDAYQCQVCASICSGGCANGCPGLCARPGTSNHRGIWKPLGAVDVTDPGGLQDWCQAHGNPMYGNGQFLPFDIPHFSHSGR